MVKDEWTPILIDHPRYDQPISHVKFERNVPDEHLIKIFKFKI